MFFTTACANQHQPINTQGTQKVITRDKVRQYFTFDPSLKGAPALLLTQLSCNNHTHQHLLIDYLRHELNCLDKQGDDLIVANIACAEAFLALKKYEETIINENSEKYEETIINKNKDSALSWRDHKKTTKTFQTNTTKRIADLQETLRNNYLLSETMQDAPSALISSLWKNPHHMVLLRDYKEKVASFPKGSEKIFDYQNSVMVLPSVQAFIRLKKYELTIAMNFGDYCKKFQEGTRKTVENSQTEAAVHEHFVANKNQPLEKKVPDDQSSESFPSRAKLKLTQMFRKITS